jgi:hypothetical protein
VGSTRSKSSPSPDQIAFSVPQFCARNFISRPTYDRLRKRGLGPKEMRPTLNIRRITLEAERDWQQMLQEPRPDLEQQATERAMKAGEAAARSPTHVSKTRRRASGQKNLERRT